MAACTGLNRLAHFLALDTFDHAGTVMRSAVYFIMYYSFASPRWVGVGRAGAGGDRQYSMARTLKMQCCSTR